MINQDPEANLQGTLQQQLGLAREQTEKQQIEKQQSEDLKNASYMAEVGLPIVFGISIAVFLSVRKRK